MKGHYQTNVTRWEGAMQGCYFVCPKVACAEVHLEGERCACLRLLFSSGTRWRYFSHLLLPTISATSPTLPRGHLSPQPMQHPSSWTTCNMDMSSPFFPKKSLCHQRHKTHLPVLFDSCSMHWRAFFVVCSKQFVFPPTKMLGVWEFCSRGNTGKILFWLPKLPASVSTGKMKQR